MGNQPRTAVSLQSSLAAVDRHPRLGERVPAGRVRVDMHLHSMWSGDCTTAPEELAADGGIDAVEVCNAKTSLQSLNRKAAEFADEFGLPGGAGSDAHVPDALGAAFVEMADFSDARSFLAALTDATVHGRHFDPPR